MSLERHREIFEYVSRKGFATADELAETLGISAVTIRRDFAKLDAEQLIRRVHGGVAARGAAVFTTPHAWRVHQNSEKKKRIGEYAASLVKNGDTLFLDAGSTCHYLATALPEGIQLRVITHCHELVAVLKEKRNIEVICAGGELVRSIGAYTGAITERTLRDFHADKSFLAASYLNIDQGCVNNQISEMPIKRIFYEQADERWVMADSSKFGVHGFHSSLGIDEFDAISAIITDNELPDEQAALFRDRGISLILA